MRDDPALPVEAERQMPPPQRASFDLCLLQAMDEDEAEAEWLRHPEAWHMH